MKYVPAEFTGRLYLTTPHGFEEPSKSSELCFLFSEIEGPAGGLFSSLSLEKTDKLPPEARIESEVHAAEFEKRLIVFVRPVITRS
jgi:hypothetical protein